MSPATERLVGRLATAGIVVLLVMASGTATLLAWPRISRAFGLGPASVPLAYMAGSAVDTPEAWHKDSKYTLILFARGSCGACQTAAPYLKELVHHLEGRAAVVFAGAGPEQMDNAVYASSLGIHPHRIFDAPGGVRARATPTLVLVDQTGRVIGSWEGVGPKEHHGVVTAEIDAKIK